jgi:hypothetical protein
VLNRRTRDRYALGVGGSYGQEDYWLSQLDPASPQEPLRCADSEPRVLNFWNPNNTVMYFINKSVLLLISLSYIKRISLRKYSEPSYSSSNRMVTPFIQNLSRLSQLSQIFISIISLC